MQKQRFLRLMQKLFLLNVGSIMKYIGGFQELELNTKSKKIVFDKDNSQLLINGRSCLLNIIKTLNIKKVFLPFFSCDSILEPIKKQKIDFQCYHINDNFLPETKITLKENEYFLYINYFGVCKQNVEKLLAQYEDKLIIDNTQAYFYKTSKRSLSFNSFRKFFGVPNGAILSYPKNLGKFFRNTKPKNHFSINYGHLIERLNDNQETAYKLFLENENKQPCGLFSASNLSVELMNGADLKQTKKVRNKNFNHYHEKLSSKNELKIKATKDAPLCYPFLISEKIDKKKLAQQGIFIPTYWPEVLNRKESPNEFEKKLVDRLLPLPIDQRYNENDCDFVLSKIMVKLG